MGVTVALTEEGRKTFLHLVLTDIFIKLKLRKSKNVVIFEEQCLTMIESVVQQ